MNLCFSYCFHSGACNPSFCLWNSDSTQKTALRPDGHVWKPGFIEFGLGPTYGEKLHTFAIFRCQYVWLLWFINYNPNNRENAWALHFPVGNTAWLASQAVLFNRFSEISSGVLTVTGRFNRPKSWHTISGFLVLWISTNSLEIPKMFIVFLSTSSFECVVSRACID